VDKHRQTDRVTENNGKCRAATDDIFVSPSLKTFGAEDIRFLRLSVRD